LADDGKLRVLIVGSGIAGVTTAHALLQDGHDVTVFEKAKDVKSLYVGSGIHLWNNAMKAIKQLGLEDRVAAVSGPGAVVEHMEFFTPKGRKLASVACGDLGRRMGDAHCTGVNRAELLPSLAGALPAGLIRTGSEVKGFTQDADGVTIRLADDTEERGDLLVGADGVFSTIREQIHGKLGPPRYAGYTIWQGIAAISPELAPLGKFPLIYGPGLRFAYYRVSDDRLYWFAVANAEEGGKDPETGRKEKLLEMFKGWPSPTEEIIRQTDENVIHRRDLYDRDPIKPWGEGRVTLVGDAAHPMTFDIGQGAGQGIEDAVVLARTLREIPHDIPAALKKYEEQRYKRTAHMQRLSRNVGIFGRWKNPAAMALRNFVTRMLGFKPIAKNAIERDLTYEF
jgi:2-polyprenyl-6-methoxyphenol hydroxylase-like FAD-dependent oxidoreductase